MKNILFAITILGLISTLSTAYAEKNRIEFMLGSCDIPFSSGNHKLEIWTVGGKIAEKATIRFPDEIRKLPVLEALVHDVKLIFDQTPTDKNNVIADSVKLSFEFEGENNYVIRAIFIAKNPGYDYDHGPDDNYTGYIIGQGSVTTFFKDTETASKTDIKCSFSDDILFRK